MRTMDQYFPAMSETKGRLFSVPRLSELSIAAAALAFALSGGFGVPIYQEHMQQARIDKANAPIVAALNHVQASIDHIKALAANQDRSTQDLVSKFVADIQHNSEGIHTVSVEQVRADLAKQVQAYAAAQALIANSPYKDMDPAYGPGADKYLAAKQVPEPETGNIMALTLKNARKQSAAANRAEIYAMEYEQNIVTLIGARKPAAAAPAPVAAPPVPSVDPVPVAAVPAPDANNRESSNKRDSNSVGNFSILGSRSSATPKVSPKNTVHRTEPIIARRAEIFRPSPVAMPPRPAQSDGFIEQ